MNRNDARARRSFAAFTLIELLMVMIIIMLLFAVSLPALAPLFASKGVDSSATQLQAVLLNARALAARNNATYAVVFNNCTLARYSTTGKYANQHIKNGAQLLIDDCTAYTALGNVSTTGGDTASTKSLSGASFTDNTITWTRGTASNGSPSRDTENCWYAIVGLHPTDEPDNVFTGCFTASPNAGDTDFHGRQVGPRYHLADGTAFLSLTYAIGSGGTTVWDKITTTGPAWSGSSNAYYDKNCMRIEFLSSGQARFHKGSNNSGHKLYKPAVGDPEISYVIGICKAGSVSSNAFYESRLAVVVDRLTGLVEVKKKFP